MAWLMEYSNPTLAYAPFSSAIQKDKNKEKGKDKENKVFCMGWSYYELGLLKIGLMIPLKSIAHTNISGNINIFIIKPKPSPYAGIHIKGFE